MSLVVKVPVVDTLGVVVITSGLATNVGNTVTVITAVEQVVGAPLHNVYVAEVVPVNPVLGVYVY